MRSARRGDAERVADILDAIGRIEGWTADGAPVDMYRAAVMHELTVIGEAASRVSDAFKAAHPAIPWKDVVGQRVLLAHHYWDTQWARVERTIREDIPELKAALLEP